MNPGTTENISIVIYSADWFSNNKHLKKSIVCRYVFWGRKKGPQCSWISNFICLHMASWINRAENVSRNKWRKNRHCFTGMAKIKKKYSYKIYSHNLIVLFEVDLTKSKDLNWLIEIEFKVEKSEWYIWYTQRT